MSRVPFGMFQGGNSAALGFDREPPAVSGGMTRYWKLSSSEISAAEKNSWNGKGDREAQNFASSSANPTVSNQHYTGLYWTATNAMAFGRFGCCEATYPGSAGSGTWQHINYVWQVGGTSPNFEPSAIFTKANIVANDVDNAQQRLTHDQVDYVFGFDFMLDGIEAVDAPTRFTLFKIKPLTDVGDEPNVDSCPTISIGTLGIPPSDPRCRLILHGDSDLITPTVGDLEYNDTYYTTMVMENHAVYRVVIKITYDISDLGSVEVTVTKKGGSSETLINDATRTTYTATSTTSLGDTVATRNPYFGGYVTGSGNNTGAMTARIDNVYVDRTTV